MFTSKESFHAVYLGRLGQFSTHAQILSLKLDSEPAKGEIQKLEPGQFHRRVAMRHNRKQPKPFTSRGCGRVYPLITEMADTKSGGFGIQPAFRLGVPDEGLPGKPVAYNTLTRSLVHGLPDKEAPSL